jgi:release factor glutamine methyltransferase
LSPLSSEPLPKEGWDKIVNMFMSDQKEKAASISLKAFLKKTIHQLKMAGIEHPRLEAEVLLAHFLNIDRLQLYTLWEKELGESEIKKFQSLVSRRVGHEPIAYILGKREFWSLDFLVTPQVLIPRPETEFVVEAVLAHVCDGTLIIDVGTGCGIIAVCLAKERPESRIYAIDLCEGALQVARSNAIRYKVNNQITFLKADLLSCLAPHSVDCLAANPPYIPTREIFTLSPEIYNFEPHSALDGGENGLECFKRLIREAGRTLKIGGWLIMEVGYGQKDLLVEEIQKQKMHVRKLISDYSGLDRVIVSQK